MNVSRRARSQRWSCLLLCLSLAFAFNSVLDAADPDYVMLQQGNEWTFEVVKVSAGDIVDKGTLVLKIGDKVMRNGHEYLQQTGTQKSGHALSFDRLARIDENGCYSISSDASDSEEYKEVALPLKMGATWETSVNTGVFRSRVVGFESITINGRTFKDCCHIQTDHPQTRIDRWLAAGVGAVKVEAENNLADSTIMTLLEFKLGKTEAK